MHVYHEWCLVVVVVVLGGGGGGGGSYANGNNSCPLAAPVSREWLGMSRSEAPEPRKFGS